MLMGRDRDQARNGLETGEHRLYVLCMYPFQPPRWSRLEAGLLLHLPKWASGKHTTRGNAIDKRHPARHPCTWCRAYRRLARCGALASAKLQHFASESLGKRISGLPTDLTPTDLTPTRASEE